MKDKGFYRSILRLALPAAFQSLMSLLVTMADNLMVSSLDPHGLSLAAVAQSAARRALRELPGTRVCSATDARMGEVYAACWERDAQGSWNVLEPPTLLKPWALRSLFDRHGGLAAGNAWLLPAVRENGPTGSACDPEAAPDGEALATLALSEWEAARTLNPAS